MNIIIAGGAGFVGVNLAKHWLSQYPKDSVTVLDNFSSGRHDSLEDIRGNPRLHIHSVDIRNDKELDELLETISPDVLVSTVDANSSPRFLEMHLAITAKLLQAAKHFGIKRYIHVSSGDVYGVGRELKSSDDRSAFMVNEQSGLFPLSPQSASKAASDLLAWSYYQSYDVPVTILRTDYVFGPYQPIRRLVPLVITHALQNQSFPLYAHHGTKRSFLHVDDLISAIDLVVHEDMNRGNIYNVGSPHEIRLVDFAELVLMFLDRPKTLLKLQDEEYVATVLLDSTKIEQAIGWTAAKSQDFQSCVTETISWYERNQEWWKATT